MSGPILGALAVPLAHMGHYAALLYAAPVLILLGWAGIARLSKWLTAKRDPRDS